VEALGFQFSGEASRPPVGLSQLHIQWLPGVHFLGIRQEGRESHPYIAEVKEWWSYALTPLYVFLAWYLIMHKDSSAFTTSGTVR
jgi:hypothetical protein